MTRSPPAPLLRVHPNISNSQIFFQQPLWYFRRPGLALTSRFRGTDTIRRTPTMLGVTRIDAGFPYSSLRKNLDVPHDMAQGSDVWT